MDTTLHKLEQLLKNDRFARHNDISLVSVGTGEAQAEMVVSDKHLNGVDIIQGGALFTLADFAFAAASNSHGRIAVASNAYISFFKAIASGKLTAYAKIINSGRSLGHYAVDIFDENNSHIAHLTATAFYKGQF